MSEMEMLKGLRRTIAIVAGEDLATDQVREELVAMAREKFAGTLASAKSGVG